MARGETVPATGFGQFMARPAAPITRVVAGALDRCAITGFAAGRWTGSSVQACAGRAG